MIARANTTLTFLRGTTEDEYGDEVPADTPTGDAVPASVIEKTRTVFDPDSPTPRIIRYTTARVGASTDVQKGDRVKDTRTGFVYTVTDFSTPPNLGVQFDMRLDLERV